MDNYTDNIDFVTVVYKRLDFAKVIHESIKKYVNYPYKFYIVNNGDNSEHSTELAKLREMFIDDQNVIIVPGIQQVNSDDGIYFPAKPGQKYSQQYYIDNYGFDGKAKYDGRILGFASWLQAEAMTKGAKLGNGKYVCHIEHDCVMLNNWVDEILPLLESNVFVSYAWRYDHQAAMACQWSIIKRETIDNEYYKEPGDLYPNCDYKDTYDLITLWASENELPFHICENSEQSKVLRQQHALDVSYGTEGFINGKPFVHHAGRGATRSDEYYQSWIETVSKYLEIE